MFERINSKNPKKNEPVQAPSPPQAAPSPQTPQYQAPEPTRAPQAPQAPQTPQAPQSQPAPAPAPAASSQPPNGQRNILSNDVHIKGSVKFTNDLLVDGRIEGEISSDGALTVAENAHIKAEVKTKSVVIYGKVHGNIVAVDRVDIKASAEMVGDVKAGTLSIEPGAVFVGKSEVGAPSSAPKEDNSKQQGDKKKHQHQGNPAKKGPAKAS